MIYIKLLKFIIVLLIPIAILLGSMRILTTDTYLAFVYNRGGFPTGRYGFYREQRLTLALANFKYVRENQSVEALTDHR